MIIPHLLAQLMRYSATRILRFGPGDEPGLPVEGIAETRMLYVHVPFCFELCPYCSFNRIRFEPGIASEYFDCLEAELEHYARRGFDFRTVYIGGGTPTVMPRRLHDLIMTMRRRWDIEELSIETNPDRLDDATTELLQEAGTDRLSIGVQSFQDELLTSMQRYDKYGSGHDTAERIRGILGSFQTVNVDMIFNLPDQSEQQLLDDLRMIVDVAPDQVTWYPLMTSGRRRRRYGEFERISAGTELRYFQRIYDTLRPQFLPASAWCFSRTDAMIDEYIVHNPNFAAAGAGSFGYMNGTLFANTFSVEDYIERSRNRRTVVRATRRFGSIWSSQYELLMTLFGGRYRPSGKPPQERVSAALVQAELGALRAAGALRGRKGGYDLTSRGAYYLVVLMREFFTAVNRLRDECRTERAYPIATRSRPQSKVAE